MKRHGERIVGVGYVDAIGGEVDEWHRRLIGAALVVGGGCDGYGGYHRGCCWLKSMSAKIHCCCCCIRCRCYDHWCDLSDGCGESDWGRCRAVGRGIRLKTSLLKVRYCGDVRRSHWWLVVNWIEGGLSSAVLGVLDGLSSVDCCCWCCCCQWRGGSFVCRLMMKVKMRR